MPTTPLDRTRPLRSPGRFAGRGAAALVGLLAALLVAGLTLAPGAVGAVEVEEGEPTTTTIAVSGGVAYGDPATLTATVSAENGTPAGTVTFTRDGAGVIAADVPLPASGEVSVETVVDYLGPTQFHAEFHGDEGFADSSASTFHYGLRSATILTPEATVLEISRRHPLKLTLTMSAHAARPDGTPIVGEPLTFSVFGSQPNLLDFGGGTEVCTAVTDADGFATCGGTGLLGSLVSILAGGSYVTHFRSTGYEFSSVKAPVIILGG